MYMRRIAGIAAGLIVAACSSSAPDVSDGAARQIERAEAQIRAAEQAEAAVLAPALLREARERVETARLNATSSNRSLRDDAQRRAVESLEAAMAAEAVADAASQVGNANRIRADVLRLGGEAPATALADVDTTIAARGKTATERVAAARARLESALRAGAREAQPEQFREALSMLDTAEDLSKNPEQADGASHVAYLVEMRARRLEAAVAARAAEQRLSSLELQAARLGQQASERAAAEERRLREEAERRARDAAAEAERARLEAERNTAAAQQQARAAQAELDAQRQAEEQRRQRLAALEAELAKIADTRRDDAGLVVTLPGIYFDTGMSVLKPGAREALTRIAANLGDTGATFAITIIGHTDSVGDSEYNQRLSLDRARAVRDHLASAGMPAAAMIIEGRGEDAPVATNETAAGRQQNRRVELLIRQRP